jgi:hypothetical protein
MASFGVLLPDWVDIVLVGGNSPLGRLAKIGYAYWPNSRNSGDDPISFGPDESGHFAPDPDPEPTTRGYN